MKPRRCRPITSSRWALWLFAAALVLKAATPLLATASAELQGRAVVEVCTVYGMSMVSVDGDRSTDISGSVAGQGVPKPDGNAAAHLDHQCPLTALAALATADDLPPLVALANTRSMGQRGATATAPAGLDAPAAWVAGHKQGPPRPA